MKKLSKKLKNDLFFSSGILSRMLHKIGKQEFETIGITHSQAYILLIVNKYPGIAQHEIRDLLWFASSTVTRFVKDLEKKEYLIRAHEGKITQVYPTDKSKESIKHINLVWSDLNGKYQDSLEKKSTKKLAEEMYQSALFLGESFKVI